MRKFILGVFGFAVAFAIAAHVTPTVTLVRRGDFVKESLPGATKFFERALGSAAVAEIEKESGWSPSAEEAKIYIGRDDGGRVIGRVVFLWMPSQHGPVGLAVAFDPTGKVVRAAVTDVGSEPLVWLRPLLTGAAVGGVEGLTRSAAPDPTRIGPASAGAMSRYYAKVIAEGIGRAQSVERVSSGESR